MRLPVLLLCVSLAALAACDDRGVRITTTRSSPDAKGVLKIIGRSTALTGQQADELAAALTEVPDSAHPWPAEIGGGHFGVGQVAITHVQPVLVVEVAADTALQAGRHRHGLRLLRVRTDLTPEDIDPA